MNNDKEQKDSIITDLRNEIIRQEKKILEYIENMKVYSKNAADVFNLRDLYEIKIRDIENNLQMAIKEKE